MLLPFPVSFKVSIALTLWSRHVRFNHTDRDMNDPLLREVLDQRSEGGSRGRRRRVGGLDGATAEQQSPSNPKRDRKFPTKQSIDEQDRDVEVNRSMPASDSPERPPKEQVAVDLDESNKDQQESWDQTTVPKDSPSQHDLLQDQSNKMESEPQKVVPHPLTASQKNEQLTSPPSLGIAVEAAKVPASLASGQESYQGRHGQPPSSATYGSLPDPAVSNSPLPGVNTHIAGPTKSSFDEVNLGLSSKGSPRTLPSNCNPPIFRNGDGVFCLVETNQDGTPTKVRRIVGCVKELCGRLFYRLLDKPLAEGGRWMDHPGNDAWVGEQRLRWSDVNSS